MHACYTTPFVNTVMLIVCAHLFSNPSPAWTSTFNVRMYVTGAGVGDVTAVIKDPQGNKNTVEAMMEDKGDSMFRCTYRPVQAGPHTVSVTFGGIAIPKSPYTVSVGPGMHVI